MVVRNDFRNFHLIKICEVCAIPVLAHYFVPDITVVVFFFDCQDGKSKQKNVVRDSVPSPTHAPHWHNNSELFNRYVSIDRITELAMLRSCILFGNNCKVFHRTLILVRCMYILITKY